jgi:hypothetical protein
VSVVKACNWFAVDFILLYRTKAVDIIGDDPPLFPSVKAPKAKPGRPRTKAVTQANSSAGATPSGSRTPVGEDWVLDCEICQRTGVNKVFTIYTTKKAVGG